VYRRRCKIFLYLFSSKIQNKYKISKYENTNKIIGINIIKTTEGYKINQIDCIEKLIK